MATNSTKTEPASSEEWTLVLPRRGKKIRKNYPKLVFQETQIVQQPWSPSDVETDPNRESRLMERLQFAIQKYEKSDFFCSFFDQMQGPDMSNMFFETENQVDMVIYGIGSIKTFEPPRLQLSLALLMKRKFDWIGDIQVFDPILSLTESRVLTSLGCTVLTVNEQGRRQALKPTLFFMPHCEAELYDNLLEANWRLDRLSNLLIFGNSFCAYKQQFSIFPDVPNSRKHIIAATSFTKEFKVDTPSDDSFRALNGSSWHFFNPTSDTELLL